MKAATLSELKLEIATLSPKQVLDICMRLAKHKKENKELITYLLFEANDESSYIKHIKENTEAQFREMNSSNIYLAKKSIRKILRTINKFIRYSGIKQTEADLRIHYCNTLIKSGIAFRKSPVLCNLYNNQLKKIEAAISSMHEDLQYDFKREMKGLEKC
ncbi:MAG: hypothetical protein ABI763_15415 [Bacteroidota bacterium]